MPNNVVAPARVREVRDLMLLYLYEPGGVGPIKQEVPIAQLKDALGLSPQEYVAGFNSLQSRRLLSGQAH